MSFLGGGGYLWYQFPSRGWVCPRYAPLTYSPPPRNGIQRDAVGKRAVCILLKCFLVTIRNNSCGKVMFSQASVILATWGVVHPPRQIPPPLSLGRTPLRADPPLSETATAADGTHPTGMHSCYVLLLHGHGTASSWYQRPSCS